jgi:hypothetical protein
VISDCDCGIASEGQDGVCVENGQEEEEKPSESYSTSIVSLEG